MLNDDWHGEGLAADELSENRPTSRIGLPPTVSKPSLSSKPAHFSQKSRRELAVILA
jgi:hypothetical protein